MVSNEKLFRSSAGDGADADADATASTSMDEDSNKDGGGFVHHLENNPNHHPSSSGGGAGCSSSSSSSGGGGNGDRVEYLEEANKRIRLTPKANNDQAALAEILLSLNPLGLKLHYLPSLMLSLERRLNYKYYTAHPMMSEKEKLKASNFPATKIRIGSWERVTRIESDLVAKCYFAKKKLVWEFLERSLKSKIEIQWSEIIAIRADIQENKPGILEIELSKPPSFHEETDPQPRKHTIWRLATDFTGGEASKWRRHYLEFPPGSLDKHYEKLLQCDKRLFELSKKRFPSLQSPLFQSNLFGLTGFPFDYGTADRGLDTNLGLHSPPLPPRFPSSLPTNQLHHQQHFLSHGNTAQYPPLSLRKTPSPISVMELSAPNEHISNRLFNQNTRMGIWEQGLNNANTLPWGGDGAGQGIIKPPCYTENLALNRPLVPPPPPPPPPVVPCQNYSLPFNGQGRGPPPLNLLNDLEDQLLSDTSVQAVGACDESNYLARVASFGALVNLSKQDDDDPVRKNNDPKHGFHQDENWVLNGNDPGNPYQLGLGQFCQQQQVPSYTAPQQNPTLQQHSWDKLTFPALEDVQPGNNPFMGMNRWGS